ncbi:hypothetical protein SCALM49S_09623 [Streptomyces californicus]
MRQSPAVAMTTGSTPRRRRAARTTPGSTREVWLATMMLPAAGAVAWSVVTVELSERGDDGALRCR